MGDSFLYFAVNKEGETQTRRNQLLKSRFFVCELREGLDET